MDVPEILVPATPTTIHPIDEPMQWDLSETGTGVIVQILDNEERLIWILALPPDATSVTVPEPPEDAVSAGLLDDALLQAHVMATSWYEEEEVSAYGYSRSIILDN